MEIYSYIAQLGLLIGVAVLNIGIIIWLFSRMRDDKHGNGMAIEVVKSAVLLIILASLLRWG